MQLPIDYMIREASPEDAGRIADIIRDCWPDDTPDDQRIARLIGSRQRITLCAWDGPTCAGFADAFATCGANGEPRLEIDLLAVRSAARGRGIASQLLRAVVSNAEYLLTLRGRARGLVRVGNAAADRAFAAARFWPQDGVLSLYVALPSVSDHHVFEGYAVPVDTFTYSGLWLESAPEASTLEVARGRAAELGMERVGTLVTNDADAELCRDVGYVKVGDFRWWSRQI